jgi:starvation-inducible DNA-binding protein
MARLRATFPMPLRWPTRDPKVGPGPLHTPSDLTPNAVRDLSAALNILLADMFALYLKTKNFHWHMSGPHFRDYHLLLDEQGDQIFATMMRSPNVFARSAVRPCARSATSADCSGLRTTMRVTPMDMLAELRDDNKQLVANLRETHGLCEEHDDVATASLLEIWIGEAERRTWFLFEATRRAEP